MSISVCDVGPRDGLQNDPLVLRPAVRAELCSRLASAGLTRIEAVSFVRPDRVPQMAGAEEVLGALPTLADEVTISALVLNERGLERALAAGVAEVHVAVMATERFSWANARMSLDDALERATDMIARAKRADRRVAGTVSVAFGCPYEGRVPTAAAVAVAEALVAAGADELILADTIGVATPRAVTQLVAEVLELRAPVVGVHLHDTRNTAIANVVAALEAGATTFESSIGGLGGCPFAPGATGNLATEDLVYLLEGEGVDLAVDLDRVIAVSRWLEGVLDRPVPAALAAAGPWPPARREPAPQ